MPNSGNNGNIIVIGGSAGALEPLKCIVSVLPRDFPATLFVVLHVSAEAPTFIPQILTKMTGLEVKHPADGEKIEKGVIYVAKPDFHMLVEGNKVPMSRGPRENRHRPAIDPLFRTAARAYGPRVIGLILSGSLDDGATGLTAVKFRGGVTIVQDPEDALVGQMPQRAMEHSRPDYVLPADEIGRTIVKLITSKRAASKREGVPMEEKRPRNEKELDVSDLKAPVEGPKNGEPSEFACPECHGVLWEERDGELVLYRCRVGHSYTESALDGEMSQAAEAALWASLRALSEQSALLKRLASRTSESQAARYRDQAAGYDEHCETIKKILLKSERAEAAAG